MTLETLKAVKRWEMSDRQLNEAIRHYEALVALLEVHGELYMLVYRDASAQLERLRSAKESRNRGL